MFNKNWVLCLTKNLKLANANFWREKWKTWNKTWLFGGDETVAEELKPSEPSPKVNKGQKNPKTNFNFQHLGQYPSVDELKKDLMKKLMSIASDGFLQQPFSVEFVEVEAAKPFLGENGEANSMHLIDHAPQVTAIVTLTKDEKFTLLVIVLNRFLQPNQLPKKESLVRACEEQKKKPKKRGCAISGKSTPLIHLHC